MELANFFSDMWSRTLDAFGRVGGAFDGDHLIFVLLAIIPAVIWIYIFFQHQRENKFLTMLTFIGGMLSVVPIFIFQQEIGAIEGWIIGLGLTSLVTVFFTSLWVGVYEETVKHWVVKVTDNRYFRDIDDAIEFSIVAALGFAFLENILYFYSIWNNPGIDNFWFYYLFRSAGSMFLHVFASGIFGYYYGVAHFAQPVLREELSRGRKFFITEWLHKVMHLKDSTVFHEEKVLEGLVLAASLHGAFDLMMGLSQHYADLGSATASKVWLVMAVPFLVGGYFWLTYLLDKKEDHKIYGRVTNERTSLDSAEEDEMFEDVKY